MQYYGRHRITVDDIVINNGNVVEVLNKATPYHESNRRDIQFLWDYYRGKQPILNRIKQYRPEITNYIVENRANEIVSFKSGYLLGEPLQYVSRGLREVSDAINLLNEFVFAEEKSSKDKDLADWMHIAGVGCRMVLPDPDETDDSPFEIYTLDPRYAFVIYSNSLGNKPLMGVKYVKHDDGTITYSCYTRTDYYEIVNGNIITSQAHILGEIPIIEYPLNNARLGAFEPVIPLLDAINTIDSNRVDGIEQFVQALMLFRNVDIDEEQYDAFRAKGAIKFRDVDPTMPADISYLINTLNQSETQTIVDSMYQTVLTICGMPSQADGTTSDSSNNGAVILRNGWQNAEARAKDSELMFKLSERKFLKVVLNICKSYGGLDLKVSDIEIRFTRRNYENILQKVQVLTMMLDNPKIADRLGFDHCGLFADSELAYSISKEEYEANRENEVIINDNLRDDTGNRDDTKKGQSGGDFD